MNQLKTILVILWFVVYLNGTQGTSKYTDENRPYEFGFTIDGEQHRHEKKDKNGIIMGEFGFITADGVYHVTVYATDENGNFKILSMKNIRVKPYPTAPSTGARQGHSLTLPSSSETPKTSAITASQAHLNKQELKLELKAEPAKSCSSCRVPTTTTESPKVFGGETIPTNQHNENKYNTETKLNNKNFDYEQNPRQISKQNYNPQNAISNNRDQPESTRNDQDYKTQIFIGNVKQPSIELNTPVLTINPQNTINENNNQQNLGLNQERQQLNPPFNNNNNYQVTSGLNEPYYQRNPSLQEQNYPQNVASNKYAPQVSSKGQVNSQNNGNAFKPHDNDAKPKYPQSTSSSVSSNIGQVNSKTSSKGLQDTAGYISKTESDRNSKSNRFNQYTNNAELNNQEKFVPENNSYGNRNPKNFNEILQSVNPEKHYNEIGLNVGQKVGLPAKPVLVAAQMQIVDKNSDIYHKNPGEKDGLPKGLTNDDMKQLLYTFNYTVGFHGHHEEGYTNGAKYGYYYVTGRNGIRTRVDYVADETGFHPKITQEMLDIQSDDVPKPETERDEKYGLKGYEFKWLYYPV